MTTSDRIVADYLDRLYDCGKSLTRTQIEELMADVREHVAAAVLEAGRDDEATVRTVLDRLGAPEDIVAAAAGENVASTAPSPPTGSSPESRSWGWREVVTVILIVPGAFFAPVLGPLAGIAFAWSSEIWDKRAKRVAYAIGAVGAAVPLLFIAAFIPFRTTTVVKSAQMPVASSESATPVAEVPVPDVLGVDELVGTNRLFAAGFIVATAYVDSSTTAPGLIASMAPAPGSQAPVGSLVSIVVVR